jgi:hypothetical protein
MSHQCPAMKWVLAPISWTWNMKHLYRRQCQLLQKPNSTVFLGQSLSVNSRVPNNFLVAKASGFTSDISFKIWAIWGYPHSYSISHIKWAGKGWYGKQCRSTP